MARLMPSGRGKCRIRFNSKHRPHRRNSTIEDGLSQPGSVSVVLWNTYLDRVATSIIWPHLATADIPCTIHHRRQDGRNSFLASFGGLAGSESTDGAHDAGQELIVQ